MSKIDLSKYGISNVGEIVYNPSYETLFRAEMDPSNEGFEKGVLSNTGAVNVGQEFLPVVLPRTSTL